MKISILFLNFKFFGSENWEISQTIRKSIQRVDKII